MIGTVSILNVGAGDTKLTFDKNNPAETIRAGRVIADMIRRGYALLVEVEGTGGAKAFQRVKRFDPERCEYIIADFDPVEAAAADAEEEADAKTDQPAGAPSGKKRRAPSGQKGTKISLKDRAIPAAGARVVAIGRPAGG